MKQRKSTNYDYRKVLDALLNEPAKWKLFGLLGMRMGVRPLEALILQWEDIDLSAGGIHVSPAKEGERILTASDDVLQILKGFKTDSAPFAGTSLADAKTWCADFSKRNGFDGLSVYSFRDMYIKNTLAASGKEG